MESAFFIAIVVLGGFVVFGAIWLLGSLRWDRRTYLGAAIATFALAPIAGMIVGRALRASMGDERQDLPSMVVWGAILEPALVLTFSLAALAVIGSRELNRPGWAVKDVGATVVVAFLLIAIAFPAVVTSWWLAG